ncbi:MAG: beta-propeller domain-containing protein [Bacillota bacterium]|nr:beta-propeller domain-containing protein [Bacillota bacterium]
MKGRTKSLLSFFTSMIIILSLSLLVNAEDSKANAYKVSGYVSSDAAGSLNYSPVKIEIEGTSLTSTADAKGYFEIANVPENADGYSIKFSKNSCLFRKVEKVAVLADTVISKENAPVELWSGDLLKNGVQDGVINISDAISIATVFNTSSSSPKFNRDYDLNGDDAINFADVLIIAKHFNKTSQDYHRHNIPLPVVNSFENLKKMIAISNYNNPIDWSVAPIPVPLSSPVPVATNTASTATKAPDHSTTISQVEGVDEADVVQTDGEYIYQVNGGKIIVAKAYPADSLNIVKVLDFSTDTGFTPREMLLEKNKLIVIGQSYSSIKLPAIPTPVSSQSSYTPTPPASTSSSVTTPYYAPYYSSYYNSQVTKAYIFDVTDKINIQKSRVIEIEGSYLSSRKIGSVLYLVTNKNISPLIQYGDTEMVKPGYRDTNLGDTYKYVGYDNISYFPEFISANYLNIAGLDVEDSQSKLNVTSYLGAGSNMYVSANNIFIAQTNYYSRPILLAIPSVANIAMPSINTDNTLIYKFSIDKGVATFAGKGEAPGTVLNQYSMDENNGYFRIATTKGSVFATGENISKNNLYIMDESLNVKGKLEGIAPGEKIYSVRFMGDRGYMVTFKKVDPLFVFDLKDPSNPCILGELKIPGYSDYLHPYDENHIIGFGKDSLDSGSDQFAWYQGMKVALFDITDVNNPVEKFKVLIGDRGTTSELLSNPKALLFSKSKNIMAFPVTLMEIPKEIKESTNITVSTTMPQYGTLTYQGAYIYNIDIDKGFTLKGRITHLSDSELASMSGPGYYYNTNNFINRIMYINDTLYTLSPMKIKANNLSDLKEIKTLEIAKPTPTPEINY